jgi:hypothetical protein
LCGSELKNKFGCCYIRDEEKMKRKKNGFVRYNIQNYTIYTHNTPKRKRERERESEGNMSTYVVTMFGLSWGKKKMDRRIGWKNREKKLIFFPPY